jgi:hypothetical protein
MSGIKVKRPGEANLCISRKKFWIVRFLPYVWIRSYLLDLMLDRTLWRRAYIVLIPTVKLR